MAPDSGEVLTDSRAVADTNPEDPDRGWLLRWFDAHPRPTFIVTRDLKVVALNDNARRFMRQACALVLRGEHVAGADARMHALVTSAVTSASFAEPVRRVVEIGDAIYVMRASLVEDTPNSLISLSLRDTSRQPTCAPLQEVFGVTKAEQRVIEQLLLGQTTEAVAETLGSSILTVRTQTKHAYAKLGVSSREELFARLLPFLETGSTY